MPFASNIKNHSFSYYLFNFIVIVVAVRLLSRVWQGAGNLKFDAFDQPPIFQAFLIVVLIQLGIFLIARCYHWHIRIFSIPFIFIGILLSGYFLFLVNSLTIKCDETFLLRGYVLFLVLLLFWLHQKRPAPTPSYQPIDWMLVVLIALWGLHSLFYFLEYNFDPERIPYGDEYGLWYASARNMIEGNILQAHLGLYGGGGIHAFGIPFIAAFPSRLSDVELLHTIYFMPFIVILLLSAVFYHLRRAPWAVVFFIVAVFVTFNNRSWMGDLLYRLVYGEGLSAVIFLAFTYEFIHWNSLKGIKPWQFLVASFFLGLVALTKFPLSLLWPVFFVTLCGVAARKIEIKPWRTMALGAVLAALPFVVWRMFVAQCHIADEIRRGFHGNFLTRILDPNIDMLTRIYKDTVGQYPHSMYFLLLAFIFLWWAVKKWGAVQFLPVATLMLSLFVYYAFIYSYGDVGQGDHGSAVRYAMPIILPLYYLGSLGFQEVMDKLQEWPRPVFVRGLIQFLLVGLVVSKLF